MGWQFLIPLALSWIAARKAKKEAEAAKNEAYAKGDEFAKKYAPKLLDDEETVDLEKALLPTLGMTSSFGFVNNDPAKYRESMLSSMYDLSKKKKGGSTDAEVASPVASMSPAVKSNMTPEDEEKLRKLREYAALRG